MNKAGLKSIFLSLSLFLILPNAFAWVSIQLDPAYLPADGESTVTITATVIGPGNPSATPPIPAGPRAGDTISFAIEQGEGAIDPTTTTTDINGQAFAVFKAGTKPEVVIIRATDTTVGQFAHGFVTAFKVEIKAPDRESAPPKFIALNGTSSYYAKTLPIPLAGDFKWSIIKKKNAGIQGSATSQSVTLKGITAGKKVDDTGLKVMFKPAGAEDYAVDMLDVTVVGVEVKPISHSAQDGTNGGPFEVKVEPSGVTETTWAWTWKAPSGAGNNPSCSFSTTNTEPTTITGSHQIKWFALPDDSDLAPNEYSPSTYTINCAVTMNGEQFNAIPASLTVTLPFVGGETGPQVNVGYPSYDYDSENSIWKVTGIGSLIDQDPVKTIHITSNSQFYNKINAHENKHVSDFINGFDGHQLFKVSELYPTLQNLSSPTVGGLINAIDQAIYSYTISEISEYNNSSNVLEQRAYQISDLISPIYFYQNRGRY